MPEPKIVITGTGRAGTTLLVRILDHLGLDTGLEDGKLSRYGHGVRAGLECRVDDPEAPTVVKDMTLGFRIRSVLETGDVEIGHVLLPTRRIDVAVASRIRAADYGRLPFRPGALTGTMRAAEQERVLLAMQSEIISSLEDHAIPHTPIEFPRFATDADYMLGALSFLVPQPTIEDVAAALLACVRPDLIHEAPLDRRERWKVRVTSAWMRLVRFPVGSVRRRLDPDGSQARLRASVVAARRREDAAAAVEAAIRAEQSPSDTGG